MSDAWSQKYITEAVQDKLGLITAIHPPYMQKEGRRRWRPEGYVQFQFPEDLEAAKASGRPTRHAEKWNPEGFKDGCFLAGRAKFLRV